MSKAPGASNRQNFPCDPAAVLRLCRATRRQLGEVQAQVTLHGSVYGATEGIIRKIDELARWLTGEAGYFSRGYASKPQPAVLEKWRRWDAIERGDEEWAKDGRP